MRRLIVALLVAVAWSFGGPAKPYPTGAYDASSARAYFGRRPLRVAARSLEILWRSAGFGAALAGDALAGDGPAGPRADDRGRELTDLLVALGPAFIKIGQSASVRSDLLPPPYVKALTLLQEDVPAFASAEARAIIAAELGSAASKLRDVSPEPVAAASLGQVHRATWDGRPVAVKVQRPDVEDRVALDMYLVREFAAPLAASLGAPGDVVGIADAWGAGLVGELDYEAEGANAAAFGEKLAASSLDGRVFAPAVIADATSRRVLTTEWVDGERLDETGARDDVPRLASLAMNSYMWMMLDSGLLHCDPHPGNLLRAPDGRLCILDWGLVTQLDEDLRLTLIEHVAHLVARDYAKVPGDLVRLGFVPKGGEDAAADAGVVDLLTRAYSKRAEGGGFANFDVPGLIDELRGLSADAGAAIFQIPPYFAYIAKAFATLEGIGLGVDPDYSILNDTLPYISERMLSDPSPRAAGALSTFVFGAAKDDARARVLDADRVGSLLDGARRYASTDVAVGGGGAERAADAILDLLKDDTPASRLVVEQVALALGARTRRLWADARRRSGGAGGDRSVLGSLVDPLGLFRGSKLVTEDDRDAAALDAAAKLAALASELLGDGGGDPADQRALASALASRLWARREDLSVVTRRVAAESARQTADRLRIK